MPPRPQISPPVFLICALFMLVGVLRLNELSMYNPDSTRYLIWGNSIAHGKGFLDSTQPESDRTVVHAPLYAVLIAPVEFVIPYSLAAAKIASIAWGILSLLLCYTWLKGLLGERPAVAGALMLAVNPLMLVYSTEALSEVPFLAAMLIALIAAGKELNRGQASNRSLTLLLVCTSLLPLLREAGIAIVAAVAMSFALAGKPRRAAIFILAPALVVILWYLRNTMMYPPAQGTQAGNFPLLFQHFTTPENAPILSELIQRMWLQAKEYAWQLSGMLLFPQYGSHQIALVVQPAWTYSFISGAFGVLKYVVAPLTIILAAMGVRADFRNSPGSFLRCAAAFLYLCGILVYPIHDVRFLFPLLPFMIFYCMAGAKSLYMRLITAEERGSRRWILRLGVLTALAVLPNVVGVGELVATNLDYQKSPVMFYQRLSRLGEYPPIFAQPWPHLAAWIRQHTPEDAVIASSAKDIAPMVGGRKILELDPGVPLPEFERILRDNAVAYIISPVRWGAMGAFEFQTRESKRLRFEPAYSVADLRLFRISSRFIEPGGEETTVITRGDSLTAGGLLRRGRSLLMGGRYPEASSAIAKSLELAPFQPEVRYQFAVTRAFLGDTATAFQAFRSILTLPQAGSYLYVTRKQLEALGLLAGGPSPAPDREMRVHDAASIYWNLGYPLRAAQLTDSSFRQSGKYFFGLLWGFHYAYQAGDVKTTALYYERLHSIDSANAVVKVFHELLTIRDSLNLPIVGALKSRLHLRAGRYYRQIELFEEAIDEGERAIAENPRDPESAAFLAEVYEVRKSARGMWKWLTAEAALNPARPELRARVDSLERTLTP